MVSSRGNGGRPRTGSSGLRDYATILGILVRSGAHSLRARGDHHDHDGEDEAGGGSRQAVHLRETLEALGPTYIKLGQALSSRPDLLPDSLVAELMHLQDRVAPVPFADIQATIEAEFGRPLAQCFASFDPEPLAAASLAQVHTATLPDGTAVVVKVQRPDVAARMVRDLDVLARMARLADRFGGKVGQMADLPSVVDRFAAVMLGELDFSDEMQNTIALRENLAGFSLLRVPLVYPEFSRRKVLTLERIRGRSIRHGVPDTIDKAEAARQFLNAFCQQILIDGLFHADLHPGNVFVADDNTLVLLDGGMIGRLDPVLRRSILRLLLLFAEGHGHLVADQLIELSPRPPTDPVGFKREIGETIGRVQGLSTAEVAFGEVIAEFAATAGRYEVQLPAEFGVLGKGMGHVDGIVRLLDPSLEPAKEVRRYLMKQLPGQLRQVVSPGQLVLAALEAEDLLLQTPHALRQVLDKLSGDRLGVRVAVPAVDRLEETLRRGAITLTVGLVASTILFGLMLGVIFRPERLLELEQQWLQITWSGWVTAIFLVAVLLLLIRFLLVQAGRAVNRRVQDALRGRRE